MDFLTALRNGSSVFAAELRPPRAELESAEGMDAWIDTYHAVKRLTREGTYVFLTDSAVGAAEEDNLRHLVTNLGSDVPAHAHRPVHDDEAHTRVLPVVRRARASERISGARRARRRQVGRHTPLRRARVAAAPDASRAGTHPWPLAGGPTRMPRRRDRSISCSTPNFTAEFFLTQVVSHHDAAAVSALLETAPRARGLELPGVFGVFYYRSANPKTLGS